jgi:hypothetical protein
MDVHISYVRATRTSSNLLNMRQLLLAERVGFEPTCRSPDKTLSRRPRYDHFGTSPSRNEQQIILPLRSPVLEETLNDLAAFGLEHP